MKKELEGAVKRSALAASETKDATDALKFTQAALNATHALNVLNVLKQNEILKSDGTSCATANSHNLKSQERKIYCIPSYPMGIITLKV